MLLTFKRASGIMWEMTNTMAPKVNKVISTDPKPELYTGSSLDYLNIKRNHFTHTHMILQHFLAAKFVNIDSRQQLRHQHKQKYA
jgi:hypothetical protein